MEHFGACVWVFAVVIEKLIAFLQLIGFFGQPFLLSIYRKIPLVSVSPTQFEETFDHTSGDTFKASSYEDCYNNKYV